MKAEKLLLRVYGERQDGQWTLLCLDFSLAAQSESLEEAQRLLSEQIAHYVSDATVGVDKEHAEHLLTRRAPLKYWLKFYWQAFWSHIDGQARSRRAVRTAIPLVPAGA